MFCEADILCLTDHPELTDRYAQWQHSKWGVSVQDYLDSMDEATRSQSGVPAWYAVLDDDGNIIAGLGVIENDFHKRPDLTPNVCAVYVEKSFLITATSVPNVELKSKKVKNIVVIVEIS